MFWARNAASLPKNVFNWKPCKVFYSLTFTWSLELSSNGKKRVVNLMSLKIILDTYGEEGRLSFVHGKLFHQGIVCKEGMHPLTKPWILRHSLEKSIIPSWWLLLSTKAGWKRISRQPMQIRGTMQKSIKLH